MPQHIWIKDSSNRRHCDVCEQHQRYNGRGGIWMPEISPICPGDDDDSTRPRTPSLPGGAGVRRPVLDEA